MFEFTKRSKKVLEIMAQSEGKRLNSDMLDPDHIMISLLKDEESVAARIMKNLGINFEKFIQDIEQSVRRDRATIILGKVPLSTKYKRIIDWFRADLIVGFGIPVMPGSWCWFLGLPWVIPA